MIWFLIWFVFDVYIHKNIWNYIIGQIIGMIREKKIHI